MREGAREGEKEALRAGVGLPVGRHMRTASRVRCGLQAGPPSPQKARGYGCVHPKEWGVAGEV